MNWPIKIDKNINQSYSEYKHSLTFRVRSYVVIATKPVHRLQIHPNTAQLDGTPYHSPRYIRVPAVVWEWGEEQTGRQTNTQARVTNIHFASATPHAKC